MIAVPNFTSELRWYNGSGCVVCGSNFSEAGAEYGVQGVDLNVSLDGTGESLGLCFTHAREAGRLVGMVDGEAITAIEESASATYEASLTLRDEAAAAKDQAEADRQTIERLLSETYSKLSKDEVAPKPKPKAKVEA